MTPPKKQFEQFRAGIRVWDHQGSGGQPADIVCCCMNCLLFIITGNSYDCFRWMTEHQAAPCPARILSSDLAEELKKMLGEIE